MTGRSTLWIGIALVLVGGAFDSPALYVPGVALAIISLGLRAWVRLAAASVRLQRLPGPRMVVEDEPYPMTLGIAGPSMPVPGAVLYGPGIAHPQSLSMRLPKQVSVEASFPRRGRQRLEDATLRIEDPLGMHAAEVRSSGEDEVLVLPRTSPVAEVEGDGAPADEDHPDGSERGIGGSGLDTRAVEFELDGLRPYRAGTPASRIHWPAVARTGELLELKLVSGGRASPLLVLDASDPVDDRSLDAAVRATASLSLHLARAGGCGVLLPGESRAVELGPNLHAWPELHARLALVEPAPPPMRRSPGGGVFWITACGEPLAQSGPSRRGVSGFRVSPLALPGLPTAFTVSGCFGQRIEALRRAARPPRASVAR